MPKVVTQGLQDVQAKRQQKFWKRFYLYRRQWNAGENKYEYEGTPLEITDWVVSCGNLNWQLDTSALNVWKDSNVSITVKNKEDEWNIDITDNIFYGKEVKDSKIQIKVGNILADDTESLIYIYTGVIKNIIRDYRGQKATIYLLGYGDILHRFSGEDLTGNQVTGENIGTGDGTTVDFYTANTGVGKIKKVYVAGVEKETPTDYSVSQLNDEDNYAKVTFVTAPSSGAITCDYIHWYQDKPVEYLVKKLIESAGITSADYEIQNVIFDNLVLVHQIWDTEAEFNACQTKQELEVLAAGSVRQIQTDWLETTTADFEAGVIKDNIDTADDEIKLDDWEILNQEQTDTTNYKNNYDGMWCQGFKVPNDSFVYQVKVWIENHASSAANATIRIYNDNAGVPGTLIDESNVTVIPYDASKQEFTFTFPTPIYKVGGTVQYWVRVWIDLGEHLYIYCKNSTNPYADGIVYDIQHSVSYPNDDLAFKIYTRNGEEGHFRSQEETVGGDSCLGTFNLTASNITYYVYQVRSYNAGVWGSWKYVTDGQSIKSLTPADKIQYDIKIRALGGYAGNPTITDVTINYIDQGYTDTHCKLMTQNIDCGTSLQAFHLFETWHLLYGKWMKFYTQSAPDDAGSPGTWESEKEISVGGQINSICTPGTTRFLRGIVYFKTNDATIRPLLQKMKLNWTTSVFKIVLANFINMTVKQAVQKLAEMSDYEFGFNATGKFFFRRKSVDTNVDYALGKGDNIAELVNVDDGIERVRNYIEASFGDYTKIMSVKTEGEDRPDSIDKYGEKRLVIAGGNLLAASNMDIATGVAMRYYGFWSSNLSMTSFNYPRLKMRCGVRIKFIPQIDLSDTVSLDFRTVREEKYAYLFNGYCFNDFIFGTSSLSFNEKLMKVISLSLNLESWNMGLGLEEL